MTTRCIAGCCRICCLPLGFIGAQHGVERSRLPARWRRRCRPDLLLVDISMPGHRMAGNGGGGSCGGSRASTRWSIIVMVPRSTRTRCRGRRSEQAARATTTSCRSRSSMAAAARARSASMLSDRNGRAVRESNPSWPAGVARRLARPGSPRPFSSLRSVRSRMTGCASWALIGYVRGIHARLERARRRAAGGAGDYIRRAAAAWSNDFQLVRVHGRRSMPAGHEPAWLAKTVVLVVDDSPATLGLLNDRRWRPPAITVLVAQDGVAIADAAGGAGDARHRADGRA